MIRIVHGLCGSWCQFIGRGGFVRVLATGFLGFLLGLVTVYRSWRVCPGFGSGIFGFPFGSGNSASLMAGLSNVWVLAIGLLGFLSGLVTIHLAISGGVNSSRMAVVATMYLVISPLFFFYSLFKNLATLIFPFEIVCCITYYLN